MIGGVGQFEKPQRAQRNAEVEVGGCRAAFFDTFVKDAESVRCMGVKQFAA